MDPDRARELLAAERARIERALVHLERQDTGEPADEVDPANLAPELYQAEVDEGLADDLREELAAVERAEVRLDAGTYGLSRSRAAARSRTSASKLSPRLSGRSRRKRIDRARQGAPQEDWSGVGGHDLRVGRTARQHSVPDAPR
jgi:DnaK suppressor protein